MAERMQPLVDKAAEDLKQNLSAHTLETFIQDLRTAQKNDPAHFPEFMQAVNNQAKQFLPGDVKIIGLDASNTKLVAHSLSSQRVVELDSDGAAKPVPLSKYARQFSSNDLGSSENFGAADNGGAFTKFAPVMLPGLELAENKEDSTAQRTESIQHNADGSITHKYDGELNDGNIEILGSARGHFYDQYHNTKFKAEKTITSDGKLLSTSIDYAEREHSWRNFGFQHNSVTQEGHYPYITIAGAGLLDWVSKAETHFDPLTHTYVTKTRQQTPLVEAEGRIFETDKDGKLLNTSQYWLREKGLANSQLKFNEQGQVSEISHQSENGSTPNRQVNFSYDSEGNLNEVTEAGGKHWKKAAKNDGSEETALWTVDDQGQKSNWQGKMFVDDYGEIVRKDEHGTEIVRSSGYREFFDTRGHLTRMESTFHGEDSTSLYTTNDKGEILKVTKKTGNDIEETVFDQPVDWLGNQDRLVLVR